MDNNLIPPHGGYRELKSFQHSELVYDANGEILRSIYRPALSHS